MSVGRALVNLPPAVKMSACIAVVLLVASPWIYHIVSEIVNPSPYSHQEPRNFGKNKFANGATAGLAAWWDEVPPVLKEGLRPVSSTSNIHPEDYAGPESCAKCHRENYNGWLDHPHHKMNAKATAETVMGDFSGEKDITYQDVHGAFSHDENGFRMRLERDGQMRLFQVTQTIGSRFFQYYVGRLIEGPDSEDSLLRTEQHVLPFGYWLEPQMWVPIVHIVDEKADGKRDDSFSINTNHSIYAEGCNHCHTTFPMADMLCRNSGLMARHAPRKLHWHVEPYLEKAHSDVWQPGREPRELSDEQLEEVYLKTTLFDAAQRAITQGVSCESCHLGCQQHVREKERLPDFFPRSPHLFYEAAQGKPKLSRTHDNVNWACGRCHAGDRPQLAAGMSTWNSTEYSDAMRGSCYSQLTCVTCHNPHRAIGEKWPHPPESDDARCLSCHEKYEPAQARTAHTHHPLGSEGSRCMNCHMPRLNEGLQDVVRTHMIFSPTEPRMIESNHPNACNQCHTDKPIDWTLDSLQKWYGKSYSERALTQAYPNRAGPTALGWLKSENESVRLLGADALTRNGDRWALPELLDMLDDSYLLNRQFTSRGLRRGLGVDPQKYGYLFYMNADQRREPLAKLRQEVLTDGKTPGADHGTSDAAP